MGATNQQQTQDRSVDFFTNKIGCNVSSPLKHVDVVGEIVEEAVYNFLIDAGDKMCIGNKIGVWKLSKCEGSSHSGERRKSLYAKVPKNTTVTVYLANGKVQGRLVDIGVYEVLVEVGGDIIYIHKDLVYALCWPK